MFSIISLARQVLFGGGYQYQSLSTLRDEIRLVTIELDATRDLLTCSLEHFSLPTAPEYVALSYCWGDLKDTKVIVVNGWSTKVTANLEDVLRKMRMHGASNTGKIRVWVDALCINQADLEERSLQVRRMAAIYRRADEVAVWLGPEEHDSHVVMGKLNNLSIDKAARISGYTNVDPFAALSLDTDQFRYALKHFLHRPYWRRVWILQEVAVGLRVRIYCGDHVASWDQLTAMLRALQRGLDKLHFKDQSLQNLQSLRDDFAKDRPIGLLQAIFTSHKSRATDPRDKVYGLLGITFDGHNFVPVPNYQQSLNEVFMGMTMSWIRAKECLDMICLQGLAPRNQKALPSWCPDWLSIGSHRFDSRMVSYLSGQAKRTRLGKMRNTWNATEGSRASTYTFTRNENDLQMEGFQLGTVDGLSTAWGLDPHNASNRSYEARFTNSAYESAAGTYNAIYKTFLLFEDTFQSEDKSKYFASLWSNETMDWLSEHDKPTWKWLTLNNTFSFAGQELQAWAQGGRPSSLRHAASLLTGRTGSDPFAKAKYPRFVEETVKKVLADNMRLMTTAEGHVGWAHPLTKPGDGVFLLTGCTMPVILRATKSARRFKVIGDCYVHGVMEGEVWERRASESEKIWLV